MSIKHVLTGQAVHGRFTRPKVAAAAKLAIAERQMINRKSL